MRDDVRPGFRWPEVPGASHAGTVEGVPAPTEGGSEGPAHVPSPSAVDPLPPIFDGVHDLENASYEELWAHRPQPDIEEPREWAEVLSDLAIDAGWLIAGIVIGLVLARAFGGGV